MDTISLDRKILLAGAAIVAIALADRAYVEAYVPYIHYVERLWQDATGTAHGHHAEHATAVAHAH